jgi:hypothetical protein
MNLRLILCAFGWHQWGTPYARSKTAGRDTQRDCWQCGLIQVRDSNQEPWKALRE